VVEFTDGSVIAQMAEPDMRLPISYALNWPERSGREFKPLDLPSVGSLDFRAVEGTGSRVIELARLAIQHGSAGGTVLNGANEVAVASFLSEEIRFGDIISIVDETFCRWAEGCDTAPKQFGGGISLDYLLACDQWSRQQATNAVFAAKR
jgi:1-deoxy-D-xylulose-5-phosphate reductoisomerase